MSQLFASGGQSIGVYFLFLAALLDMLDLSSLTKDQTCTLCVGSVESQPLDHQGIPSAFVHFKPKFVHSEGC